MSAHTLLLVDPDPSNSEILRALLPAADWRIEHTPNALAASDLVRAHPYEFVVANIELLDSTRALRPDTKFIVLSGDSTAEAVIRAMRSQAFSYFSKPFSANGLADLILQAAANRDWQDDLRLVSAASYWIGIRMRCKIEAVDRVIQLMRELEAGCKPHERENVASAFRELLLNAIEHGGRSDPDQWVQITRVCTAKAIVYVIQDPGQGFSFDAMEHAAIANPPGDPARHLEIRAEKGVRPGGFGILLTRNLVDELIYNEKGNEVLFIKYLR